MRKAPKIHLYIKLTSNDAKTDAETEKSLIWVKFACSGNLIWIKDLEKRLLLKVFFAQIALRTGRTQTISFIELAKVDSEIPMVLDLVGSFNTYASNGGSSGSEIGDGGGGGNAAGSGSSIMVAVGVTMQIVYYLYDQCYNRYNSHGSVINTLQSGKARDIPLYRPQ